LQANRITGEATLTKHLLTDHSNESGDLFLRPGIDAIEIRGKTYFCESRLLSPDGYIFVDPEAPDKSVAISNDEIWRQHECGALRFAHFPQVALPRGAQASIERALAVSSDREKSNIARRLKYMTAIDEAGSELHPCEDDWQSVCDRVAEKIGEPPQHWKTHYKWWLLWTKSGRNPKVLAGNERGRGNRESRLTAIQLKGFHEGSKELFRKGRPRVSTAHSAINAAIIAAHGGRDLVQQMIDENRSPLISYKTVWKRTKADKRSKDLSRRFGSKHARQEMKPVYSGPETDLPLGRVEADFKFLGLMVIDDVTGLPLGTPYIMAGVDCYSGSLAGFDLSFDPPSAASAARCLAHIIQRKRYDNLLTDQDGRCVVRRDWPINGVPREFDLDNDTVFHAKHFEVSARALGCDVVYLEPGRPSHKGTIESLWRTVVVCFTDMFPGRVLRVSEEPDPDYKPEDYAVVTLSELRTFLTYAFVEVYNQTVDEPSGEIRIERYRNAAAKHPPQLVPPHDDILELVGAYEKRTVDRRGIRLFDLRYNSGQLAAYRDTFPEDPIVDVRHSPDDVGEVLLVDAKRGISFSVPCVDQEYARGLTLYQHNTIKRHAANKGAKAKSYIHGLMLAKAELFRLAQDLLQNRKSRKARQQLARFVGAEPPDRRPPARARCGAIAIATLPPTSAQPDSCHVGPDDAADIPKIITASEIQSSPPSMLRQYVHEWSSPQSNGISNRPPQAVHEDDVGEVERRIPQPESGSGSSSMSATNRAPERDKMQLIKIRRPQK
jgi:putative transposase